jgi:type I restriction enzyme S subunit
MARDFRSTGIPLLRLAGLKSGAHLLEGCDFLDPAMVESRWHQFQVLPDDVLLSTSASLGEVAVVDETAAGAVPYTGIIRFRPRDDRIIVPFVEYALRSPWFRRQIEAMGVGSVLRHFGPMHLRQMTITTPPVAAQRAITGVLGAIDDKIKLNRRLRVTILRLAISTLASERSRKQTASTLCRLLRVTVRPMDSPNQIFSHFSLPSFDSGEGPVIELGRSILSHKLAVTVDCLLLSRLNPDIHRVWLPDIDPKVPAIASTEWLAIEPAGPWRHVMFATLNGPEFLSEFASLATGTTGSHQRVSAKDFLGMPLRWPEADRLSELEARLKDLFDLAAVANKQNRILGQIRDLLLPKLMSGEIRLEQAVKAVVEAL